MVAFVSSENPWVERGGNFNNGGIAGVFTANNNNGNGNENDSFRPVLWSTLLFVKSKTCVIVQGL